MTNRASAAVLGAVAVSLPLLLAQAPPAPIVGPVFVGAREITGSASTGTGVTVTVTIAGTSAAAQVDPKTGRFTFRLPDTVQLTLGSVVSVKQTVGGVDSATVSVTVTEPFYDWAASVLISPLA